MPIHEEICPLPIFEKTNGMKKTCPRCHQVFDCQAKSEKHCFCSSLDLDPATLEYLQKTHYDCLCADCLTDLNAKVLKVKAKPFDPKIKNLEEGEYFYKENGLIVLTELYHLAKGSCCMSGCRHCAYGFHILMGR